MTVQSIIGLICSILVAVAAANAESPSKPTNQRKVTSPFKVFWGIGTQVEDLADQLPTDPKILRQVRELKGIVDGYSLGGGGGMDGYWPGRPYECSIQTSAVMDKNIFGVVVNGKVYSDDPNSDREMSISELGVECKRKYFSFLAEQRKNDAGFGAMDINAYGDLLMDRARLRVVQNLGLRREQERGKMIQSAAFLDSKKYSYDGAQDRIKVNNLDGWPLNLSQMGMRTNNLFVYQSGPRFHALQVPLAPGAAEISYLPSNVRMLDLLGDAYTRLGQSLHQSSPTDTFSLNIRYWDPTFPEAIVEPAVQSPFFAGFNIERGPVSHFKSYGSLKSSAWHSDGVRETQLENEARAISYLLANSDNNIFILMPGFLRCAENISKANCTATNTDETRAVEIEQFNAYLTDLNGKIREMSHDRFGLCNSKIVITPASYGWPIVPHQLPIRTNVSGKLAGTVGGRIVALDKFRRKFCVTGPN